MKVNEFIEMYKKNPRMDIAKQLEVKKYLSVKNKENLIDSIVRSCLYYEDRIYKINGIEKYINFTMQTIATYTNIELSDDIESDYDALCEADLLGRIIDTFDAEYQSVLGFLQMKCDYILASNSVASKVGTFLDGIMEKIDGVSSVLENKIENFKFDDLNISSDDLNQITQLLDILK